MEKIMQRFNLWLTSELGSKVLCYGDQSDMEELAAIFGSSAEVRPDSTDSPQENP
jgi:hypothetical protein